MVNNPMAKYSDSWTPTVHIELRDKFRNERGTQHTSWTEEKQCGSLDKSRQQQNAIACSQSTSHARTFTTLQPKHLNGERNLMVWGIQSPDLMNETLSRRLAWKPREGLAMQCLSELPSKLKAHVQ